MGLWTEVVGLRGLPGQPLRRIWWQLVHFQAANVLKGVTLTYMVQRPRFLFNLMIRLLYAFWQSPDYF